MPSSSDQPVELEKLLVPNEVSSSEPEEMEQVQLLEVKLEENYAEQLASIIDEHSNRCIDLALNFDREADALINEIHQLNSRFVLLPQIRHLRLESGGWLEPQHEAHIMQEFGQLCSKLTGLKSFNFSHFSDDLMDSILITRLGEALKQLPSRELLQSLELCLDNINTDGTNFINHFLTDCVTLESLSLVNANFADATFIQNLGNFIAEHACLKRFTFECKSNDTGFDLLNRVLDSNTLEVLGFEIEMPWFTQNEHEVDAVTPEQFEIFADKITHHQVLREFNFMITDALYHGLEEQLHQVDLASLLLPFINNTSLHTLDITFVQPNTLNSHILENSIFDLFEYNHTLYNLTLDLPWEDPIDIEQKLAGLKKRNLEFVKFFASEQQQVFHLFPFLCHMRDSIYTIPREINRIEQKQAKLMHDLQATLEINRDLESLINELRIRRAEFATGFQQTLPSGRFRHILLAIKNHDSFQAFIERLAFFDQEVQEELSLSDDLKISCTFPIIDDMRIPLEDLREISVQHAECWNNLWRFGLVDLQIKQESKQFNITSRTLIKLAKEQQCLTLQVSALNVKLNSYSQNSMYQKYFCYAIGLIQTCLEKGKSTKKITGIEEIAGIKGVSGALVAYLDASSLKALQISGGRDLFFSCTRQNKRVKDNVSENEDQLKAPKQARIDY